MRITAMAPKAKAALWQRYSGYLLHDFEEMLSKGRNPNSNRISQIMDGISQDCWIQKIPPAINSTMAYSLSVKKAQPDRVFCVPWEASISFVIMGVRLSRIFLNLFLVSPQTVRCSSSGAQDSDKKSQSAYCRHKFTTIDIRKNETIISSHIINASNISLERIGTGSRLGRCAILLNSSLFQCRYDPLRKSAVLLRLEKPSIMLFFTITQSKTTRKSPFLRRKCILDLADVGRSTFTAITRVRSYYWMNSAFSPPLWAVPNTLSLNYLATIFSSTFSKKNQDHSCDQPVAL